MWVMHSNSAALLIVSPPQTATESWMQGREKDRRKRRRESVPWERSDLVSEILIHTHPRYCDTAFMSAPGEHKPTGLVSVSQCPREQSPSSETKRGWLRFHLHHKGKPFLPEPLPVCSAIHHIYQRPWTHVTSAFFFLFFSISISPSSILSLWPTPSVHQQGPPPPPPEARVLVYNCTAVVFFYGAVLLVVMYLTHCASNLLTTQSSCNIFLSPWSGFVALSQVCQHA